MSSALKSVGALGTLLICITPTRSMRLAWLTLRAAAASHHKASLGRCMCQYLSVFNPSSGWALLWARSCIGHNMEKSICTPRIWECLWRCLSSGIVHLQCLDATEYWSSSVSCERFRMRCVEIFTSWLCSDTSTTQHQYSNTNFCVRTNRADQVLQERTFSSIVKPLVTGNLI